MLAADVELTSLDGAHLANWLGLMLPPAVTSDPRWAVVFIENGQPVKIIVAGTGAIDPARAHFAGVEARELDLLRRRLHVQAVLVLDTGALPRIHRAIDSRLRIGDDFVQQCLVVLHALKGECGRGLWSSPRLLELLPTPSYEALQRTFDLLVPDDSAMVAYVFEDGGAGVHASVIATKRKGDIDLATTHQELEEYLPAAELARDWRRQYRRLNQLVTDRHERPCVSVFLERRTWYRVLTGPSDQLAREITQRNVIIDPAPAWLLGLLSGATIAAMASRGARALAHFMPAPARRMASELASTAGNVMKDSGAHPFSLLGFDPIELWKSLRHFYRDE